MAGTDGRTSSLRGEVLASGKDFCPASTKLRFTSSILFRRTDTLEIKPIQLESCTSIHRVRHRVFGILTTTGPTAHGWPAAFTSNPCMHQCRSTKSISVHG